MRCWTHRRRGEVVTGRGAASRAPRSPPSKKRRVPPPKGVPPPRNDARVRPTWPFARPTWPFVRPTWPFVRPTWPFVRIADTWRSTSSPDRVPSQPIPAAAQFTGSDDPHSARPGPETPAASQITGSDDPHDVRPGRGDPPEAGGRACPSRGYGAACGPIESRSRKARAFTRAPKTTIAFKPRCKGGERSCAPAWPSGPFRRRSRCRTRCA